MKDVVARVELISDCWGRLTRPKTAYDAWLHQDLRVATLRWLTRWAENALPANAANPIDEGFPESKDPVICQDLLIGFCARIDLWRAPSKGMSQMPMAAYDRLLRHRVHYWNQVMFGDLARRVFLQNWLGKTSSAALGDMRHCICLESVQRRHMEFLIRQRRQGPRIEDRTGLLSACEADSDAGHRAEEPMMAEAL